MNYYDTKSINLTETQKSHLDNDAFSEMVLIVLFPICLILFGLRYVEGVAAQTDQH